MLITSRKVLLTFSLRQDRFTWNSYDHQPLFRPFKANPAIMMFASFCGWNEQFFKAFVILISLDQLHFIKSKKTFFINTTCYLCSRICGSDKWRTLTLEFLKWKLDYLSTQKLLCYTVLLRRPFSSWPSQWCLYSFIDSGIV